MSMVSTASSAPPPRSAGKFADEIVPMTTVKQLTDKDTGETAQESVTISADEGIRPDTTYASVSGIKPAFEGASWRQGTPASFPMAPQRA